MADRPILFSGPMVRALLEGRKTQTRRVLKKYVPSAGAGRVPAGVFVPSTPKWVARDGYLTPQHKVGDRLWVRETFTLTQHGKPVYRADARDQSGARWSSIAPGDPGGEVLWKPSIFMPRWASRITLTVTGVRVEPLQDISREDAIAEGIERVGGGVLRWENWATGIEGMHGMSPQAAYALLWNYINGPGSWDANPWICAISFDVRRGNIDALPKDPDP